MVAMMDEAGVDRAVVVPPSPAGDSNATALEAAAKYPDRFIVMGRFNPKAEGAREQLQSWKQQPGMAGIRMGFAVGRKDLLAKITPFGGQNSLPITAVVAAKASLEDADLIATRKKIMGEVRADTIAWLKSQGYTCTPSVSNCFMLDVKRPGKEVQAALAQKLMFVGRIWPAWPNHVRITVGTADEMMAFRKAFTEVMSTNTAGMEPAPLPGRLAEHPHTHLS